MFLAWKTTRFIKVKLIPWTWFPLLVLSAASYGNWERLTAQKEIVTPFLASHHASAATLLLVA
jgi:hypothetical protein